VNPARASAEDVLEQFLARVRGGEDLDPREFAGQHPDPDGELLSALEAAVVMVALERAAQRAEALDVAVPERVGAYRIVREVGRGGMGVVLEAVEEPLGRRVALKVLPPELYASASARARFRREAELAARLDHPGIATLYGAGVADERPWIAMRFVDGETLSHAIARSRDAGARCVRLNRAVADGRDTALTVAACVADVARALQSAHEQGVLHRDVKPGNVILTPEGAPVLVDFGLAIAAESDGRSLTRTGDTPGTPAYIAPEHVSGERARHDPQSDVYALGVTLYECLTLRRPFDAPTQVALYRAILSHAPTDVRAHNRDVPRDLAVVVATAMERDRARRYGSAQALAADLEACVDGRTIAARPVPLTGRAARWIRREPRMAALVVLLVVATIGLGVLGGSWLASRDDVRAAERTAANDEFENAVQTGFANLTSKFRDLSRSSFVRALEIKPRNAEALAGLALVELHDAPTAALAVLSDAPATPEFDALRAIARGESPAQDNGPSWFLNATAIEMFIDGMRLKEQVARTPPSARGTIGKLCMARFDEAIRRSATARFLYYIELANAAFSTGDEAAMRSAAAALVALWPDQERALYQAGMLLYQIDPKAAIPILEQRIELFPEDSEPHSTLAGAYFALQEYDLAQHAIERALARDARNAYTYNTLSAILRMRGCIDEAHAALERAVEIRPSFFEAWINLAFVEATAGDPARAEFALACTLAIDPGSFPAHQLLAEVCAQRGAFEEALAAAETLIGLDPRDPGGWSRISRFELELGRADRALDAAECGLELAPKYPELEALREEARRAVGVPR
jgi:serine/threonine protein kinase/predicted Zn-dependent protease